MASVPYTVDELTPQWLSAALSQAGEALEVTAVRVCDSHTGTTGRAVIELDYARPTNLPTRMFVKLPPQDQQQRDFVASTGMGRREVLFYQQLSSEVPVRVPRCFFAASSDAGDRYLMLLEDLASSGCTFNNASQRYSLTYLREVLTEQAQLHAQFWHSPRFDSDLAWVEPPRRHALGVTLVQRALDRYGAEMPAEFTAMARLYIKQAPAIHELWSRGTPTLVHGDIHDGNLFYHARPGMLDWALVARTSAMRDVAYFLAGTLRSEDYPVHAQALFEFYLQQLEAAGVAQLDREQLHTEYCWHVAYVWVAAVTTLAMGSQWQPENYVLRSMARLNQVLAANTCVTSLQAALTGAATR